MTRLILVMVFISASYLFSQACDSCGSNIMGQQGGLLSQYRKSYASFGWSQSGFQSTPGIGLGSADVFNTFDISLQHFLSRRWSIRFYQPFILNQRSADQSIATISGFGDTQIGGNYTFFMQKDEAKPVEIFLDVNAGFILPTGKYDASIHSKNLPENFNPGNGSTGFSFGQTNSVSYGSMGVVLKNNWTIFSKTKEDYQFGHQWSGNLLLFWNQKIDSSFSLVPLSGIQVENIHSDTYANGKSVHGTGGNGLFFSIGSQLMFNNWLCTFQYSIPLSNTYSQGEVDAGNRINLQLTHLF